MHCKLCQFSYRLGLSLSYSGNQAPNLTAFPSADINDSKANTHCLKCHSDSDIYLTFCLMYKAESMANLLLINIAFLSFGRHLSQGSVGVEA